MELLTLLLKNSKIHMTDAVTEESENVAVGYAALNGVDVVLDALIGAGRRQGLPRDGQHPHTGRDA